jgi:hypothetical protein
MRTTTSVTVAALAAALLLTACDSGGAPDAKAGGASPAGPAACKIHDLDIQVGPASTAPAAGDTGNIPVTLTNQGAECTLKGFPALDLNASDMSTSVPPTQGAKSQKLSLAKDAAATFTVTYVRGPAGGGTSLDVRTLMIGLPGAAAQKSFKWTYGPVQGGGTKGDLKASVSAFTQAGD